MPHRHPALLRAYERVSASGWSSILGLVPPHGSTIAAFFADWEGPRQPEEDIFGTGDPEAIAASVELSCARSLGSPIEGYEFFGSGVLSVHGLRLADGLSEAVKAVHEVRRESAQRRAG